MEEVDSHHDIFLDTFDFDFAICLPSPTRLIGESFLSIVFATVPENDGTVEFRTALPAD